MAGLTIGASVTLSRLEDVCRRKIASMNKYQTRVLREIVEMLRWFAGKQIRNVAAVGGNIITGSPISDLNQVFRC
jgi:xanthine dehydrogenase/oxidase